MSTPGWRIRVHAPKHDVALAQPVHLPMAAPPCRAGLESLLRPREELSVLSSKERFRKEIGRSRSESGFKTLVPGLGRLTLLCFGGHSCQQHPLAPPLLLPSHHVMQAAS